MTSNNPLSVVHFSTADTVGGSARSASRIHIGLRARGIRSRMLVGFRYGNDPDVQAIANNRVIAFLDRLVNKLGEKLGLQYRYVPSCFAVGKHPWVAQADIVQLFNTHGGYFSQNLVRTLGRRHPIVWRLSDLWPMTGHCAYPGDCQRWQTGCGNCPDLGAYPSIGVDTSAHLFKQKIRLYKGLDITVVAPSSWTEAQAKRSPLLGQFPVVRIPNGLNGSVFRGHDRSAARSELGLPQDARIVLFCAHVLDDNPRKGGDILIKALNALPKIPNLVLALMGKGGTDWSKRVDIPVFPLGFQTDVQTMAKVYAAVDVVAIPSVLENLPNTLIETLACGRAVVASDCGGMRDGVIHGETGLLSPVGDYQQLALDLQRLLDDDALRAEMEKSARGLFDREFSSQREIEKFAALYQQIRSRRAAHGQGEG